MISKEIVSVLDLIHKVTGFDAQHYRCSTLKRRQESRLLTTKSKSYKEYLSLLKKDPSEYHKFLETFTINVTEFFRDKRVFLMLKRKILPDLLEKITSKKRKRIRIWSIGCAGGQEPFSLAIILDEIMKSKKYNLKITIHATDVNKTVLKQANRAQYKKAELKNVPRKHLNTYFTKINKNEFKIKNNIINLIFRGKNGTKKNKTNKNL